MTAKLYPSVPASDYHEDNTADGPTLSSSIANILVTSSPAHARAAHPRLNENFERKTEDKFDLGTVVHALLLQGLNVMDVLAFPDYKTNAAKEARDQARAHGRIPILTKDAHRVTEMVNAVAAHLADFQADPIPLTNGKPEQTIVWEEQGVMCRARIDWLHDDMSAIDDLKTTSRSANPDAWSRNLYAYGCDVQAAFYLRGLNQIVDPASAGVGYGTQWRWLVVETTPPYALSVVTPGPDVLALADAKVDYALATWKRCLETDTWPGYPRRVATAELPAWEESRWLAREAAEEFAT
jgi:hypothetical protein